jgi:hypothetical protein
MREPDDLTLVVAGADLPIPSTSTPLGHPPCRVTREIVLRAASLVHGRAMTTPPSLPARSLPTSIP